MNDINIYVICVSKPLLLPNILNDFVDVPGYNISRFDCGRRGGVCIYVQNVPSAGMINLSVPKQAGIKAV